jgi:hypothetical protein
MSAVLAESAAPAHYVPARLPATTVPVAAGDGIGPEIMEVNRPGFSGGHFV